MQSYASSVQGAAIRVTRLSSLSAPATGTSSSYVLTSGFIRASLTPEYDEGEEFVDKGASGEICSSYKSDPIMKWVNVELEICEPDVELTELIDGGTLLTSAGSNVGYATPLTGATSGRQIALEVWSHAIVGGSRATTLPYYRWVVPLARMRLTGDRVIENGRLATVFSGIGYGNTSFGDGPANDVTYSTAAPLIYYRDSTAPSTRGYFTVV
jgi:hypothetical protein